MLTSYVKDKVRSLKLWRRQQLQEQSLQRTEGAEGSGCVLKLRHLEESPCMAETQVSKEETVLQSCMEEPGKGDAEFRREVPGCVCVSGGRSQVELVLQVLGRLQTGVSCCSRRHCLTGQCSREWGSPGRRRRLPGCRQEGQVPPSPPVLSRSVPRRVC